MIRVLYLDEISEIAGGANSLTKLATHINRERYTPVVACPPGPLAERMHELEIEHLPFQFRRRRLKMGSPDTHGPRLPNLLALLQKIREGLEIARLLRRYHISLLHTNSLSAHIAGLVAARLTQVPIIWHVRTFWPRLLYQFALPDRLIFVSGAVRAAAFPNSVPEQAQVIYNGEDLSIFDPGAPHVNLRPSFGLDDDCPLVAIIGRLEPWKGHRDLLKAWQIVLEHHPNAHLLVVGDEVASQGRGGRYRIELEQLALGLGIADRTIFFGFRSDIVDVLHTTDVFVSASHNDPNPRSVLEAMAMGKAISGTRSGGVPEMVVDGESALLVDTGDILGLAAAIERLLGDASLRAALGQAARQRALAEFSIDHHSSLVESLYEEVLTERQEQRADPEPPHDTTRI
jgi:glycosyltransferase involved in cell wall biosynthesis